MNNLRSTILSLVGAVAVLLVPIMCAQLLRAEPSPASTKLGQVHLPNGRHQIPLKALDTVPSCRLFFQIGFGLNDNRAYQPSYDTLRHYIEICAFDAWSPHAFGLMDDDVQRIAGDSVVDSVGHAAYRKWLESVLYLNTTNPAYFCACLQSISGTFNGINSGLAVLRYMIQETKCDDGSLLMSYDGTRNSQRASWALGDTTIPLDTTLPTMQQLGLDSLLAVHFKYAWVPSGGDFGKHAASYSVSENPLHEATTLRFELTDAEYVRVEVFDVLGATTPCPLLEKAGVGLFAEGPHQIPIDFSRCTSGTYYLRITLGTGEVRTIKIVKE